jgi:hypothetical protein
LLGFLESTRADTFFHSEFVAATLAALVRRLGFAVSYEGLLLFCVCFFPRLTSPSLLHIQDYLLDEFYRESNYAVVAQDVLLELNIKVPRK